METSAKRSAAGVFGGVVTSYLAIHSLGMTSAIAMPRGVPVGVWVATAVFGVGVFLPAPILHPTLVVGLRVKPLLSLCGFCVGAIAALSLGEGLTLAGTALASLVLGALAAVAVSTRLGARAVRPARQPRPSA